MTKKVPILLYHDLESDNYPTEKRDIAAVNTVVFVKDFAAQIKYLADNNYKTISLEEFSEFIKQGKKAFSNKIIITFDDGHYSNYYLAYPILKDYGFKATFFITTDRIGNKYHLTRDQIKEMADNGMEFGSHGLTHKDLPLLNIKEIEFELVESKRILESITKKSVNYIAFPGGHYNKNVLELLESSGYFGACSCLQGLNSLKANKYLLKRLEIRRGVSVEEFKNIFNPFGIALYQSIDSIKMLVRKSIGLEKYSRIRSKFYKFYIFKR